MHSLPLRHMDRVAGYGGLHSDTASLRNVLARQGAIAPHTGETWSEAMLFGMGGGTGAAYFVLRLRNGPTLALSLRHLGGNQSDAFLRSICTRLNIRATTREDPNEHAAENDLVEAVLGGQGVLAWTDRAALPYYRLPSEMIRCFPHVVAVTAFDEDAEEFEIDDRAAAPVHLDAGRFRLARHSITSLQHRFMTIEAPSSVGNLRGAVLDAIREGVRAQTQPPLRCFGTAGLHTWSRMLTRREDPKGWPTLFPRGRSLFRALRAVCHHIETSGTGGGGFRPLYGDFLIEASTITGIADLDETALGYHALGDAWAALADAALPDACPRLAEAKRALRRKYDAFASSGDEAAGIVAATSTRLAAIELEMELDFPLDERATTALLGDLADRLERIEDAEKAALAALGTVVG